MFDRPLPGYGYSATDRYSLDAQINTNDKSKRILKPDCTPGSIGRATSVGTDRKKRHELIDHLKLDVKKWKHKYELCEKDKKEVETRFGKTTLLLEEWKSKARSYELELNHLNRKFDNQVKEMTMGNHREVNKMTVKYCNKIDELQNKLTHQSALNEQLKQLKQDLSQELETIREKYANAKNYSNSLENRLEMSMKRATNIQSQLSEKLSCMKQDSNEHEMKYLATIERLTNQLKVKQSDIDFLRDHLTKERQANNAKHQELSTRHESKIKQLQNQIDMLNKQLIKMEEQKEDYARTSISATDSLNKAVLFISLYIVDICCSVLT